MAADKLVSVFDSKADAEAAKANLIHAGYHHRDVSVLSLADFPVETPITKVSIWRRLFGDDVEEAEAKVYAEAVKDGGYVLVVRAQPHEAHKAMGILHHHRAVDLGDRAVSKGILSRRAAIPACDEPAPAAPITADLGEQEVLRLAEEHLEVGKRIVDAGTLRVRRYVIDKPVEAKVTLHEEHAEVVRKAVNDPKWLDDVDWGEKSIEFRETAEEPVVTKHARLREEVGLKQVGSDRVETVHDTVRSQEVEIEELPPVKLEP